MGTVDIVVKGKQAPVATMGNGQTLGELAFFQPSKRFATATARERTQLARIPFDKLSQLLTDRPTLALLFYRNACMFLANMFENWPLNVIAVTSSRRLTKSISSDTVPSPRLRQCSSCGKESLVGTEIPGLYALDTIDGTYESLLTARTLMVIRHSKAFVGRIASDTRRF
jgi:Cyclic nucleotide-binding domain